MSYSYFLLSLILRKGLVELENDYRRVRMIREMECLSSRNGSMSLSNLNICEKYVGEGEGSLSCFQNKNKRVSNQLKSQNQRVFLHIVVSLWNISQQDIAVLKLRSTATRVHEWETPCGVSTFKFPSLAQEVQWDFGISNFVLAFFQVPSSFWISS